MIHTRPPFPVGWSSIEITPGNLSLRNCLPVGQSFLWHRTPLLGKHRQQQQQQQEVKNEEPAVKQEVVEAGPSSSSGLGAELEPEEEFSRAVYDPPRVVCLRQTPTRIYYTAVHSDPAALEVDEKEGTTTRWMRDYFHLDRYPDLEGMYDDWRARDKELFGKVELNERAKGVRLLRQDPWECLIAFITSTNNHIPRIASLMHKLSQHFSPPLLELEDPDSTPTDPQATTYHLFPPPDALPVKLEALLRELGFGYRAGFIDSSLATLRAEFGDQPGQIEAGLKALREEEDAEVVREKLIALKGVGRKVADCVMLMCLDQPSLIPIDTHLLAIAARHPAFPSRLKNKPMSKPLYEEIQTFLLDKWGPMAGWCQAVMFAADLKESTVLRTPRALVKTDPAGSVKAEVKLEAMAGTASPASPTSTLLATPGDEPSAWIGFSAREAESPLKGKGKGKGKTAVPASGRPKAAPRTPSSSTKRKFGTSAAVSSSQPEEPNIKQEPASDSVVAGLPPSYAFKRTRSAARIELARSSSGIGATASELLDLHV